MVQTPGRARPLEAESGEILAVDPNVGEWRGRERSGGDRGAGGWSGEEKGALGTGSRGVGAGGGAGRGPGAGGMGLGLGLPGVVYIAPSRVNGLDCTATHDGSVLLRSRVPAGPRPPALLEFRASYAAPKS